MRKEGTLLRGILAIGMLAAPACSIKEIREDCPCYLPSREYAALQPK